MFTTKTPQDFYNQVTKTMASLPKTPEDVKAALEKVKNVYTTEAKKAAEVIKTYQKASTGDASPNDIADANKKAQSLAVTARFAAFMSVPGAIFMVPALAQLEQDLGSTEIIPESVKKEFSL